MRMRIDEYTGEPYDADKWYRRPCGCWVNKAAEKGDLFFQKGSEDAVHGQS